MESKKIALVTGANKGIGFEACRQLAKNDFKVILTARDQKKGMKAAETLQKENLDIVFHQLDITDEKSIDVAFSFIKKEFGKLDVLVNNAAILIDPKETSDIDAIRKTFDTNTLGSYRMCKAALPLMIKNNYGRIINISSGMGQLSDMGSGYPAYRISKTALNAVTRIFASETSSYNIKVNSMCPGWVKTDMGGQNAPRTPTLATETIVWLATLPAQGPSGTFFRDKKKIEW